MFAEQKKVRKEERFISRAALWREVQRSPGGENLPPGLAYFLYPLYNLFQGKSSLLGDVKQPAHFTGA
jgi:hypothetical protein